MVNERVFKIAETGQIPANDPVSNIMSQVEIKQDGEPGLWGSFKKWAGSKGGRMTLGGLGTALGVGLSGGDFRDALGYGVIGAGNTAKTMYRNEQDAKHWADREAQRNLYWQNYEAGRRLQRELQNERIEAQKEQTAAQYQNALNQLAAQYQYNQMGLDAADARAEKRQNKLFESLGVPPEMRPYMAASALNFDLGGAMDNYHRNILLDPNSSPEARAAAQQYFEASKSFDAMMRPPLNLKDAAGIAKDAGLTLDVGAANEGRAVFENKPATSPDTILLQNMTENGIPYSEALQRIGKMSKDEKIAEAAQIEQTKANISDNSYFKRGNFDYSNNQRAADAQLGRDKAMADYNAQIAEEKANNDFLRTLKQTEVEQEYKRQFEFFIRTLPTEAIREIQWKADMVGMTPEEYLRPEIEKRTAEALKAQREAAVVGRPSFGELQTGVNNQTISADRANAEYGGNYFQQPKSKAQEEAEKIKAKSAQEMAEAERQNRAMYPRVAQSIARARRALKEGTGLGQFGGWGWTTGQGGQNRADIQAAQAQINTFMRGLLKSLGVGSTELNSAAEAVAYRYLIEPDMPVEQVGRMLDNFERDYMDGTLMSELQAVAGQYKEKSGDLTSLTTEELIAGL